MRIIAGMARSMPLKTVPGMDTRPTTDRIKETLFNILQPRLYDAVFLDLFAGSGAIGLEAVSRGARQAVFVEHNRKAAACIQANMDFTRLGDRCQLKCMDYLSALRTMEGKFVFDVIFMDPPYGKALSAGALEYLSHSTLCDEYTTIIIEESLDFSPESLEAFGFTLTRVKAYKTNQHMFFQRSSDTP